ncbi:MAG: PfkB family carbohydrate kinase, partial [Sideroxydans sp.]
LAQRNVMSRRALKTLLHGSGVPSFLDINLRPPWYSGPTLRRSLQLANTVKLNADEMAVLAEDMKLAGDNMIGQARTLMQDYGLERMLITCGADGAWLIEPDGSEIRVAPSARSVTVVDTVGAGDGFSAVFILGMMRAWPVALTLERAHVFAATICEIRGAIPDQDDFYQPFRQEWK